MMITRRKYDFGKKYKKNGGVKSSDTNTDVSNRIFVTGDNIVKHVRGYELSRKVKNCKVLVRAFRMQR